MDTVWYLIDELGNSIQANSAPEVTLSTLSTENCNTYFRQYLYFETLQGVQERYETVSCEAIVSVDVDDVIESISRRTAFLKSFAGNTIVLLNYMSCIKNCISILLFCWFK